jgi:hypothetical protein
MESGVYVYEKRSMPKDGGKWMFELGEKMPNGFFEAKIGCNSKFLLLGAFERYLFYHEFCRPATEEESLEYWALKNHSLFALRYT